jgi:hypothetical protein
MPLTSTSTEFLLLAQKVDLLQWSFEWIVSGITLAIGTMIALFLGIQFFSYKRLLDSSLKNAKREFTQMLEERHDNLDKRLNDSIAKLDNLKFESQSSDARIMATHYQSEGRYDSAYLWWVYAASRVHKSESIKKDEDARKFLSQAEMCLQRLTTLEIADKDRKEANNVLENLSSNYPEEVTRVKNELERF